MKPIFLLGLLLPIFAFGQSIADKADELLTAYTTQQKFSGNVLIAKEGKIVFQKAYGMADLQNQRPNTLETEFRAGSLTKMFTSAVILQLAEKAQLSLTDPVAKYLPHFPDGDKIQIMHLLSHTSGIKGSTTAPVPTTLNESVDRFKAEALAFQPGERFEYNNFNFILLSYIAEKVTGKNLSQLMQSNVFNKAGMMHTGLDENNRKSANKALGYVTNPKTVAWEPMTSANVAIASGAGALYTTVVDLYKWSEAIATPAVLKPELFQKAITPVKGNYGLGWIVDNKNGRIAIGHTGSIEGYIAYFMKYPKEDVTIIYLSNYRDANGRQLAEDLTSIVFNEPYNLPKQKQEITLSLEILNNYAGEYQLNDNFKITVSVENNKLYALAPGDIEKVELTPETETKFFLKGPEIEMEFIKESGKVQYLFIKMQGGQKLTKVS